MAYAAVLSLKHTIQRLLNSSHQIPILPPYPEIIQLAYEKVEPLERHLTKVAQVGARDSEWMKAVEKEIREAAVRLADLIESSAHVSFSESHIVCGFDGVLCHGSEERGLDYLLKGGRRLRSTSAMKKQLRKLKGFLTSGSRRCQIVSIWGMAGIGKTTLAKEVYGDPDIFSHFECRVFVSLLPEDTNGSRVLLTTRIEGAARIFRSIVCHKMRLLTEKDSWDLLCEKVFGKEHSCRPQLEEAGKKIANKCGGLPLAIIAIAKHLFEAEPTPEYWSKVAEKEVLNIIGADPEMSKALYLSYNRLPPSLQLEYQAMEDLEELECNSVVLVCQQSSYGKIKTCKLHSVFRHLCIKEAGKDKVFHILYSYANQGKHHPYPVPMCLDFRLLRVLDALTIRFYGFPIELVKLIQLRYLSFTYIGKLPASISKLQNLQYLIVHQYLSIRSSRAHHSNLPMEIWDMKELRHLQVMGSDLPAPTPEYACLPNLLTLLGISARSCTKGVLRGLPKLQKLGTRIELPLDVAEPLFCSDHLVHLADHRYLESFKCSIVNPSPRLQVLGRSHPIPILPRRLRKLTLSGLGFPWEYMSNIAKLRNLEVLKLRCYAFQGPEWKSLHGKFRSLTYILIEDTDLEYWRVRHTHFPRLQRLFIHHCYKLKEIPFGIEETIEMLEIVDGSPSLVASAKEIQEEQQRLGNEYLQVCVKCSSEDDHKTKS
ncbi:UNVERIFIED_CONTAM: putative late blight resistance proteinR1A-4 [Sesamum radiatum]|uniref:Late blight resistance proteinR1A-4 n=1 Tax=Sesamum radiatum TaxID=300843 RepID=A0AAW2RY42_SESRA